MKVYNLNTKSNFEEQNICLTIGNFDGVHKGHQFIIDEIKKLRHCEHSEVISSIRLLLPMFIPYRNRNDKIIISVSFLTHPDNHRKEIRKPVYSCHCHSECSFIAALAGE